MRRYSRDVEERVRALDLVGEWMRSGLLEAEQGEALMTELAVDLRRTNPFLRAGLALFTALIVAACVGLVAVSLDLHRPAAIGVLTALAAFACIMAADVLAGTYRLYRFGIEEALAVAAVVLLCISQQELWPGATAANMLLIAACGALGLYLRYGYIYAAVGGAVCAALIPFQFDLGAVLQRSTAAAVGAVLFAIARAGRLKFGDDFPGDEYGDLQALGLIGVYAALNVQLAPIPHIVSGAFYWFTYLTTWILPAAGVWLGLRDRDRTMIDAGALLALLTLITSKPYLGWTRNPWDPIVLGACLIAGAVLLRRWLKHGPGGERHGFMADRIFDKDRHARAALGTMSVAVPQHAAATAPPPSDFGGGRSGGGGGGASF